MSLNVAYCRICRVVPRYFIAYTSNRDGVRCCSVEPFEATNFYEDGTDGVTEAEAEEVQQSDDGICPICRENVTFWETLEELANKGD